MIGVVLLNATHKTTVSGSPIGKALKSACLSNNTSTLDEGQNLKLEVKKS